MQYFRDIIGWYSTLKVIFDSPRCNAFWKHDSTPLNGPADQELSWLLVQIFGKSDNSGIIHSSGQVIDVVPERAVRCCDDVLLLLAWWTFKEINNLLVVWTIPVALVVANMRVPRSG